MTELHVKSEINIELDNVLEGMSNLDTQDLEKFMAEVSYLLARRRTPNLSSRETELLQFINEGNSSNVLLRYQELLKKSQSSTISPSEREELLALVDVIELADAQRLEYLIELSQIRQVSLEELMNQLGIHHPPVYG